MRCALREAGACRVGREDGGQIDLSPCATTYISVFMALSSVTLKSGP